jgi:hypothetical protein
MASPGRYQARVDIARIMQLLSIVYQSPKRAFSEYVANAADACKLLGDKGEIFVILRPGFVGVLDTAGMGAWMLPEDEKLFNQYVDGKITSEELTEKISTLSKHTYMWMMQNIGFSSRDPLAKEGVAGLRGIGSLAGYSFAQEIIYYSRPPIEDARKYWQDRRLQPEDNYVCKLTRPSFQELQNNNIEYQIDIEENPKPHPLRHPRSGIPLEHGTLVVIQDFQVGKERELKFKLKSYLSEIFSEDLVNNRYRLWWVDQTKSLNAKPEPILPSQNLGIPIPCAPLELPDGSQIGLNLFYKSGVSDPPLIIRSGSPVCSLPSLDKEFQQYPWSELSGKITIPTNLAVLDSLDGSKQGLRSTPWTKSFIKKLSTLVKHLTIRLEEINTAAQQRVTLNYSKAITEAFRAAIRQIPLSTDLLQIKGKPGTTPAKPRVYRTISVAILDGPNGVPGIPILLKGDTVRVPVQRTTPSSGEIDFGELGAGNYQILLTYTPKGSRTAQTQTKSFTTTQESPGYRHVVQLSPKKRDDLRPGVGFEPVFEEFTRPFRDPEARYHARFDIGQLAFNIMGPGLREAWINQDIGYITVLVCKYTAKAVAHYNFGIDTLEDLGRLDPKELKMMTKFEDDLFERMYSHLRQFSKEIKQSEVNRKRRLAPKTKV